MEGTKEVKAIFKSDTAVDNRYQLLVDSITDYAIYLLDDSGHVSSWNSGANRFKGYTEAEILGENFFRFYTPEDREAGLPDKALATAASEGRFEAEGWRVRKDGTRFWAHVIIDAIRDPVGVLVGYAKITRDLSERRIAEQELRKSEEQFRLLVQGVSDYAIYMLDPEGNVSSWNPGAQRTKGYTPSEIIGQHFSRFYTDEDKAGDRPRKALDQALSVGRFESESWRVRKDGSRFWATAIIDAIHGDDGTLIGFAKVTRDITENRRAQEALEKAQLELFQAQKMEAVGQLTGGVAHDFNNLLTVILGSLEIARKRALAGQGVVELIDHAIEGARRGASLTQRLLAFSRKQELQLEPLDVPDLVKGMTDLLQRSIGTTIEISTTFPLGLPLVMSDPNQLENALLNLVVNARDAMPDGGTITFSARRRSLRRGEIEALEAGDYVSLSVADEGEGMDASTLKNATTPFFTTKGIGKGTGLGLPMIQGLMAQSGGKLLLQSTKGEGTTAELWLPVAPSQAIEVEDAVPKSYSPRPGRPLMILVVDDDPLVRSNVVLMLEDLGHSTEEASSGEDALQILSGSLTFDLILTDHSMPKMTGLQLADRVKETRPDLPVLLASGYAEIPDTSALPLPRIGKPFTQTQLESAIWKAVE